MIRIIDYGVGNVQAFLNVYKRLGIEVSRAREPGDLDGAEKIILPGVGAFDHAMQLLERSGLRGRLDDLVLGRQVPVLGVCVGMQILSERSDEGKLAGLGWIPGQVRSFAENAASSHLPLPHMGWNDVRVRKGAPLLKGLEDSARFYFLHSYYFECKDPSHVVSTADYGFDFACIVASGNIYGVQCHPEKSHQFGARLLRNFAEL